jgi:hypothetical protein
VALVIREEDVGWVAPPGDPEALSAGTLLAARHEAETAPKPARARTVAETEYAADIVLRRFARVVDASIGVAG